VNRYIIERRGGLAGLKASGAIDGDALSPGDRQALEQLIDSEETLAGESGADRYTYVVTRQNASGSTTREIPESLMPIAAASVCQTEI
jgi:hypothetical protein